MVRFVDGHRYLRPWRGAHRKLHARDDDNHQNGDGWWFPAAERLDKSAQIVAKCHGHG